MYGFAGTAINYLQDSQTIPVEEQTYGLMLAVVVKYSVPLGHTVQLRSRKILAVVGITF
jgi:hypothetical protein